MIIEAKAKINQEIEKLNNPYVKVVGDFLLKQLEVNPSIAERIMANDKTIMKSLEAMRKEAEKKKVGNMAVLTGEEGFKIVADYYGFNVSMSAPVKEEKEKVVKPKKSKAEKMAFDGLQLSLDDYF